MSAVIFLDVDGPLHPTSAIAGLEPGVGIVAEAAKRNLMRWAPILASIIEMSGQRDVSVVIHSDWRLKVDRTAMQELLAPLSPWLAGSTDTYIRDRYSSILDLVERASIDHYIIIDDDLSKFPKHCAHLVAVDPELGLSDEAVQAKVEEWLKRL